jgi:hypothetical protein
MARSGKTNGNRRCRFRLGAVLLLITLAGVPIGSTQAREAVQEEVEVGVGDSVRKINRQHARACQLLERKRSKTKKFRRSKRRVTKWR